MAAYRPSHDAEHRAEVRSSSVFEVKKKGGHAERSEASRVFNGSTNTTKHARCFAALCMTAFLVYYQNYPSAYDPFPL